MMQTATGSTLRRRWQLMAVGTVGMLSLAISQPVLAQEKLMRTLTVTGQGTETIVTTFTQVRLGVEAQGKTAEAVQSEVAQRSNSVVNFLKSRRVEKLETTGVNLNPNYRYDNGKQTLTGYSASNTVSFRVDTKTAGSIMDEAVKAGASRIDGISFIASDGAIANARKTALKKATQDAQEQADAVLGALGLSRQEIVSIQVNGATTPPPRPIPYAAKAMAEAAPPSPVMGGDQEVEASVTLQISY